MEKIKIFGAREHNLKNVDLELEKNKLIVFTGPSGSGKSSLAMDTLFVEGKRRYVESLSSYARQFLGTHKKPAVDKIEGLCPSIAIEQKTVGYNPRSTVGTTTEVYDYLRVLFARVGKPFCPNCDKPISTLCSVDQISESISKSFSGRGINVAARIAHQKKGEFRRDLEALFKKGFRHFLIDSAPYSFTHLVEFENLNLAKTKKHTIYVIIDNFKASAANLGRIREAVVSAFDLTQGSCTVIGSEFAEMKNYSTDSMCFDCQVSFVELEPRLFSFNSPMGACKECNGLGCVYNFDIFSKLDLDDDGPASDMVDCPGCSGTRLNSWARSVKIDGFSISDLCMKSIKELAGIVSKIKITDYEKKIVGDLLSEINKRLGFLVDVGLSYLNLARGAGTLSGGESQRIRLATQVGSQLSGVMYVLDEPSIGLHQRDNDRLIQTLLKLRDLGNSLIVVEHDLDTMLASDYIVDIGPGAGIHGGQIVAQGTAKEVAKNKKSVTGAYLSGQREIKEPEKLREPKGFLQMINASKNNLKNIDVKIPLGLLCSITGVSGSGKSSLINHCLATSLRNYFHRGYAVADGLEKLEGVDQISNVVVVDQKSIGRTSRSTPSTYLGIYGDIRTIFSRLPESQMRGYTPGTFSFNVSGGRCENCGGEGKIKISMQFLDDVVVECKVCKGRRYDPSVLEVKFNEKSIADVLEMSVEQALEFFKDYSRIKKRLQLMMDVGLGYITLGQPTPTISGGEGQRIKLVNELSKRGQNSLYILDEPTTGLHFEDIEKLIATLNRLVDAGNSVVVIEHNLDVIKSCDYVIDVGPEGGDLGGEIMKVGAPRDIAKCSKSFTGKYLKKILKS